MKRTFAIAGVAATALLMGLDGAMAADAGPIRIGFSLPKTGIYAPAFPSQENAYNLWKDQVNAAGGLDVAGGGKRKVEFVEYDDRSDPAEAAKIYEKLIVEDKVDLLLGPWGTPHHIAVAGVLERHKFPMVGDTAASVALRGMKPGYIWFPTSALPDEMGKQLPELLKSQGVKTVSVTTAQYIFSIENKKYLEEGLKASGIKVLTDDEYPVDIKDMTALVTKVKSANPDAEISLSMPGDSVLYLKTSKELGLQPKVQYMLVGPTAAFFTHIFGNGLEGLITMGHWSPSVNAKAKAFYDAYVAKYKDAPDYLDSSLSYESCEILQEAVAKVGLDHEKLKTEFASDTFDTIDGPVKFKGVVNATTPTMFLQYQKDRYEIVWPASAATAKLETK